MQRLSHRTIRFVGFTAVCWAALLVGGRTSAGASPQAAALHQDKLWQHTVDLVARGDFTGATETIKQVLPNDGFTKQVRGWLEEYQAKQAARKELDRAEFEKYVAYAEARIDRKEYKLALGWLRAAADAADDREAFLASDLVGACVNDALAKAQASRKDQDWRGAWGTYWQLVDLYESEPRYSKLEREVSTHLRLDLMFEPDSGWEEYLEDVRWEDAKEALRCIDHYYVEPADFKRITEAGLEQLLLLAESKTAQETFEELGNEDDRNDFTTRLQVKLDQVRAARSLDYADCIAFFRRVVLDINRQTVHLPEALVVREMMQGAFEGLDEFTSIIWPREAREFDKHTRGAFPGVGIQIIKNRAQEIEVVTPLDDTPAYRAGIQAGDIITRVDGIILEGRSLNKVVDIITGPEGTPVSLTVRRNGEELEFPLVRALVKIRSVKGARRSPGNEEDWDYWLDKENGIAHVRVTTFAQNTVQDVGNVVSDLLSQGLKGLVLDLRSNAGGLLDSAWRMSSLFLKRGDGVVSTQGRISRENARLVAHADGPFADIPLVVLVNEGSASASEIVSGAIRDNRRGTVIGARTFGKFSVQNLIPLGYASSAKLKITTAKYYLPNGDSLHRDRYSTLNRWGVEPDIPVRLVRWERANVYQMRRDADLLGPPAPKKDETAPAEDVDGEADTADKLEDDSKKNAEKAKKDEAEDSKEDKLPPLEQPDENNRPMKDPQLDTALLLLRVTVLAQSHPTLANAELGASTGSVHP